MTSAHHVNQIAPNYLHSTMQPAKDDSFTFTVGKLDAGMAILIGDRASLIEFPSLLLPQGVQSGSVVNIRVLRNQEEEDKQRIEFEQLQEDILTSFGTDPPKAPQLRLRNVTQTSVTLEWDRLFLSTADLLSLDIYRNGQRLAPIPNPLHNTSTKLSGLDVNAEYTFHLVMRTSAGTYSSPVIRTRTHTINDTSGISVCFGHVADPQVLQAAKDALANMKAKWSDRIQIDTTHFVCTDPRNPGDVNVTPGTQGHGYAKAMQLSIPAVLPHWIFACHDQKKMVNISPFYLDQDPPNAATLRESINQIRGKSESTAAAGAASAPTAAPVEAAVAEAETLAGAGAGAIMTEAAVEPEAEGAPEACSTPPPPPPLEKSPKLEAADSAVQAVEAPAAPPATAAQTEPENKLGLSLHDDACAPAPAPAPAATEAAAVETPPMPTTPTISLTGPDETTEVPVVQDTDEEVHTDEEEEEEDGEMDDVSLGGAN